MARLRSLKRTKKRHILELNRDKRKELSTAAPKSPSAAPQSHKKVTPRSVPKPTKNIPKAVLKRRLRPSQRGR